jgi:porin
MSENHRSDSWLSFGLAFVGGYCDAAGYVLAKTFTGHITGTLVLAAISVAGHDWQIFLRHLLTIALFLTGVVLILISERFFAKTPSRFLLLVVMGVEIVLISTAYFALTSPLTAKFELFVSCMSLALGLQNGAFSQAGGISVHSTYLTGMTTSLLKTAAEGLSSQTTRRDKPASDQKVKLLGGIWVAFVLGATVGAAMVFWLGAPGVVGAAFLLLAMVIGQCASRGHGPERKAHREIGAEFVDTPDPARPRDRLERPSKIALEAIDKRTRRTEPISRADEKAIDQIVDPRRMAFLNNQWIGSWAGRSRCVLGGHSAFNLNHGGQLPSLERGINEHSRRPRLCTYGWQFRFLLLFWSGLYVFAFAADSQTVQVEPQEPLPGPDSHETGQGPHGHLFGDWGGERTRLLERGVIFDFQYVSDSLWDLKSEQKERFASWNRFRGAVDIDFGALTGHHGLYFHATALWQGGGNLGAYLGLLTSPSGMSSANTCRLDSWWFEKRWLDERITARAGQFAGQDFYGAQHYAASFIFEPMGYALGNLFTTFESFDPPSTPAVEIRVVPIHNVYVKSMVLAGDRSPFSHNPTGLVPQFRGDPVSVSEIGFTPGKKASSVRAFDNVEGRKGYSGLYQFGASYNPGKFTSPTSATPRSGNYLLYWMTSQALWRVNPEEAKGLDATFAYDWSPPSLNRNYKLLTAGLRFNEPLPLRIHNTMSLGYVRNSLSPDFLPPGMSSWKSENALEFNALLDVAPMLLLQPVIQYYASVGGGTNHAVVFGFRTKVEF